MGLNNNKNLTIREGLKQAGAHFQSSRDFSLSMEIQFIWNQCEDTKKFKAKQKNSSISISPTLVDAVILQNPLLFMTSSYLFWILSRKIKLFPTCRKIKLTKTYSILSPSLQYLKKKKEKISKLEISHGSQTCIKIPFTLNLFNPHILAGRDHTNRFKLT